MPSGGDLGIQAYDCMGASSWFIDVAFELRLAAARPSSQCHDDTSDTRPFLHPSSTFSLSSHSSPYHGSADRLRPGLPAISLAQLFGTAHYTPGADVPFHIICQRALRGLFGRAASSPTPASTSAPSPHTARDPATIERAAPTSTISPSSSAATRWFPRACGPFRGDVSVVTWNCQAFIRI